MAQFIEVAQHCRSYHNFSSMMAIIVAGLLSPSIRRLKKTRVVSGVGSAVACLPSLVSLLPQLIPKLQTERFKSMESLLSSKNNYKNYRNELEKTAVPAVPFVGELLVVDAMILTWLVHCLQQSTRGTFDSSVMGTLIT